MTIQTLINVLAVLYGAAVLDGALQLGFSEGTYVFIGLIQMVIIIRLLFMVNKK